MSRLAQLSPNAQGIALMLVSLLLFTLMDAIGKALVAHYPVVMVVWWRNAGQLLLLILLFRQHVLHHVRTRLWRLHILRALAQTGAAFFFFLSLTRIGLAEATAIMDLNPVLITLGAAVVFGERLGPRRIFGVLAAMLGSLIIIRPGSDVFTPFALVPVLAAVCYATFALVTRGIGRREDPWTALIWTGGGAGLILGMALPATWVTPAGEHLAMFLGMAVLGTVGQFFMIRAFSAGEASVIAPFGYVGLLFATLWGFLFFGEMPDIWTGVGATVIVLAGLYVWHREMAAERALA